MKGEKVFTKRGGGGGGRGNKFAMFGSLSSSFLSCLQGRQTQVQVNKENEMKLTCSLKFRWIKMNRNLRERVRLKQHFGSRDATQIMLMRYQT